MGVLDEIGVNILEQSEIWTILRIHRVKQISIHLMIHQNSISDVDESDCLCKSAAPDKYASNGLWCARFVHIRILENILL